MPVSRFCALTGIPRRSYHRWQARARHGQPVKGPWPAPVVDPAEALVAKYAAHWPAWGHRKIYGLMRADGHRLSVSSVERAMRRRGLLQPIDYQGERRELAKARKAAFAENVFEKSGQMMYSMVPRGVRVAGWPRAMRRAMVLMAAQRIMASETAGSRS
jgi:hypothetical protein